MLPAIGPTPWQHRPDTSGNRAFFPQMLNCAKMIGMDPRVDGDYLWIAEQARDAVYEAHLPAPWRKLEKKKGTKLDAYYNAITHTTTHDHPALPFFRKLFQETQSSHGEKEMRRQGHRKMTAADKRKVALEKRGRKREKHLNRAALRVQRIFRGRQGRAYVQLMILQRELAAGLLQAGFRGMQGRRSFWAAKRQWAATVFQRYWRGRAWRTGGGKELHAAAVLQRGVRAWRTRKQEFDSRLAGWLGNDEDLAVRTVQQALRRRARNMRAKRDYELLSVVDASKTHSSFFEVRKISTRQLFGLRVYRGEEHVQRGRAHISLLERAKNEVPFFVKCHTHFRVGERYFAVIDWHVCNIRRLQFGLRTREEVNRFAEISRIFAAEALLCLAGLAARNLRYGRLSVKRLRVSESGHIAVADTGLLLPTAATAEEPPVAAEGDSSWVAWCFGTMLLELLTGLSMPEDADDFIRQQLVRQARSLLPPLAVNLVKACLLPGREQAGLPVSALMTHPYFTSHGITPEKLWNTRPFGLSGPTEIAGPIQVRQKEGSYGARVLERRLADLTMLTTTVMAKAREEHEQSQRQQAMDAERQQREVEAMVAVAQKLRATGRIREYKTVMAKVRSLKSLSFSLREDSLD